MKTTIINGKKYKVEHVFNMVGNYYFTDKHNTAHLVDSEDVQIWAEENNLPWQGIDTAIEYAKEMAANIDEGIFWWTTKPIKTI